MLASLSVAVAVRSVLSAPDPACVPWISASTGFDDAADAHRCASLLLLLAFVLLLIFSGRIGTDFFAHKDGF